MFPADARHNPAPFLPPIGSLIGIVMGVGMFERHEWNGAPHDPLHAVACALLKFSGLAQNDCRELLELELLNWLSTARSPVSGNPGLPEPAR